VGWPLVTVHVTGTDTVVRGGKIRLVCKASGSTRAVAGGRPRSVVWVKDGRRINSEVYVLRQYFLTYLDPERDHKRFKRSSSSSSSSSYQNFNSLKLCQYATDRN